MNEEWIIAIGVLLALVIGIYLGRKSKNGEIEKLHNTVSHEEYKYEELKRQSESIIHEVRSETIKLQSLINKTNENIAEKKREIRLLKEREKELLKTNSELHEFSSTTLNNLRKEGALLPSAVRWSTYLQEMLDQMMIQQLESPPHPALSAAKKVKEAAANAREWKKEAGLLRNRIDLYESQAPWLNEYAEFTIDEIITGLREEKEIRSSYTTRDDPVQIFLSLDEWKKLSNIERNQLALDRYWEGARKRSAWIAGIQYERYVGYVYEKDNFEVEYHGAIHGKEDLGIDLVCRKGDQVHVVQCKRLSPVKGIPVRENVVSQTYGAGMFLAMCSNISLSNVVPTIFTTYELSKEARKFAEVLGVAVHEHRSLEKYPCIKCNVSGRSGEKIYHLPFDQKYDVTKIGNVSGEFYANTVLEAEKAGFRRAFKWRGQLS